MVKHFSADYIEMKKLYQKQFNSRERGVFLKDFDLNNDGYVTIREIKQRIQEKKADFFKDFDGDGNIEELVVNSYLGEVDFALLTYEGGLKKCTLNIKPQKNHPSLINTVPLCNDLLLPKYKRIRIVLGCKITTL